MKTKKEELQAELTRLNALRKQVKEKLKSIALIEVVVGKWYKDTNSEYLVCVTNILGKHNYVEVYGFGSNGNWFNKWDTVVHQLCVEATPQEVEKALIEEAKRRGVFPNTKLTVDTTSIYNHGKVYDVITKDECFRCSNNLLEVLTKSGAYTIFKEGQWATIIEQDKFAQLKEAHSKGAVIQYYSNSEEEWEDVVCNDPLWCDSIEYRIKPEEKPTLKDNDIAIIERLHDALLDNHGYDLNSKLLSDSRELCKRIQCIIEKGAN